jgi:hypothetical protein
MHDFTPPLAFHWHDVRQHHRARTSMLISGLAAIEQLAADQIEVWSDRERRFARRVVRHGSHDLKCSCAM